MNDDDLYASRMAELIGNGFFDLEMTEDGMLYYQLSDKAMEIDPVTANKVKQNIINEVLEFAKKGYVEWRFTDDLDFEYRFTDAGIEYLKFRGNEPPTD